jgi:uncharacterized protein (DUF1810 family)
MLDRFINAQERTYEVALAEIKNGQKKTHWMWYIFPQLRGLGFSQMAYTYGIVDLNEAKEYLAHPILSERLIKITKALLDLNENDPEVILGDIDALKLKSSMTLFSLASEEGSVFYKTLEKFFEGSLDRETLKLLDISTREN